MINWIKKKMKKIIEPVFEKGDIIEMSVAKYSHEKKPYYVVCTYFNKNANFGEVKMTTSIPDMWSLQMIIGNNWAYHYPRMKKVGTLDTHGHLLHNQNLVCRKNSNDTSNNS